MEIVFIPNVWFTIRFEARYFNFVNITSFYEFLYNQNSHDEIMPIFVINHNKK